MKVTDGVYKEGDVATAPSGNKWARRASEWWSCFGLAVEMCDEEVAALGLEVTREAPPEPPAFIGVVFGQIEDGAGHGIINLRQNCSGIPWGTPIMAVVVRRDTFTEAQVRAALEGLQGDGWETVETWTPYLHYVPGVGFSAEPSYEYELRRRPVKDAPAQGGNP